MIKEPCLIYIVDDDQRICEALCDFLEANGVPSQSFNSIGDYVKFDRPNLPGCLVLDINLPDISGLEFQSQFDRESHPPIVFVTGHGDIPSSVRAMKHGAVDFLTKPFEHTDLLNAVQTAVAQDRVRRAHQTELTVLKARLSTLTPREREVLPLVVSGLLNKQAAAKLAISEVTFQIHRGRVMQKMQAKSVAQLVMMAQTLQISMPNANRSGR
ncbi:FixJ family two-component response regulator [Phyllobacterium trifolii]|jgi:FixJ family two-component response regulator|uniref:FixJ family two-component response regulator n=1 Tax=Phyllobacterium trifolii TaxID=300193 RepID=A0A839UIB5_9HYPH|nr:response regulator [Phyllobacterium trifolii]MBB3148371.1 FixJ family two-component response regulator [Phyllobacterium trifolii]